MASLTVGTTTPVYQTLPSSFVTSHDTDGLNGWGAFDWFRPAGTIVGSPVNGKVERWSGSGGTSGGIFGVSMYLRSDSGQRIFLTHFADRFVQPGKPVTRGQPLGRVSPWTGGDPHIHIGAEGAPARGARVVLDGSGPITAGKGPVPTTGGQGGDLTPGIGWSPGGGISIGGRTAADLIPDPPGWNLIKDVPGIFKWVGGNWDRVLQVLGGSVLAALGLYLLAKQLGAKAVVASLPSFKGDSSLERMAGVEQRQYETTVARAAGRERADRVLSGAEPAQRAQAARQARIRSYDAGEIPY